MKKLLLAAVISLSAAAAFAGDHAERQIYGDSNFEQNRVKAVKMLEQRGYQVHDVDADDHWGKPVLEVEAYKNGHEYDIVLSYPDLKIIKEQVDY
ncbi:PepSY domain-containing protein [Neisseria cinerea]|uniref:PepSY domain-containing protein n=1 Tax=Neisseria cinerea TaxID=483 RepID=UPI000D2FC74F|nr:PepSY domain-containing protein [Neisseria cinerea]